MGYQEIPHAAVNALMHWVHQQGKQVVSLHSWSHRAGWSEVSEWSAHIEVRGSQPLHVRIKRKGYKFSIVPEPDDTLCPACSSSTIPALVSQTL